MDSTGMETFTKVPKLAKFRCTAKNDPPVFLHVCNGKVADFSALCCGITCVYVYVLLNVVIQ